MASGSAKPTGPTRRQHRLSRTRWKPRAKTSRTDWRTLASESGWSTLYYSIFYRGRECLSSFEDSAETIDAKIQQLRDRIDGELATKDPWGRKASR